MKIIWRPQAEADRDSIFEYIAEDNPHAALELDEEFDDKAETAARNPLMYRAGRVSGTREIVVRANYIMVYRIEDGGAIEIQQIVHARRQWPPKE
ncbi:MAG: type II toxin-antitoxin system RelE/ParE family toxin [Betaproteobacteria bacterium]|nr:type II toxin-antitoxin system RelE/ParE family toxin [Betaproteobacteria bacterium]MCL2886552.1 type II toxin-antitoxin system RelE/ParE family toxin [Betaproteobacteria bacterium]